MARVVSTKPRKGDSNKSIGITLVVLLVLVLGGLIFVINKKDSVAPSIDNGINTSNREEVADKPNKTVALPISTNKTLLAPSVATQPSVKGEDTDKKAPVLSAEEQWRIADSNRLAVSEALLRSREPKKHFDNEVENTLEVVSKPGAQFLQLPVIDMAQEDIIAFLKKPIDISPDDDEAAIAAKERTAEVKAAALEYIEKGGTINQFIRDMAAAEQEAVAMRDEVRMEMRRILARDGEEAAQAYLDEVNPQLKENGIKEIKIGRGDRKYAKSRNLDNNSK